MFCVLFVSILYCLASEFSLKKVVNSKFFLNNSYYMYSCLKPFFHLFFTTTE